MPSEMGAAGTLILVVGPSGAGKDSLIDAARARFAKDGRIVFARRSITRPADAGGEEHEELLVAEFESRRKSAGFMLHWQAYGLLYGISDLYREDLDAGKALVVNVSRMVLNEARRRFARVCVLYVTAIPEIIAGRIAARGRENGEEIAERLRRAVATVPTGEDVVTIVNDGKLAEAAASFEQAILCALDSTPEHRTQTKKERRHEAPAHQSIC